MPNSCYGGSMKIMDWYAAHVGDDAVNAVAMRSGLAQTTLNRQVQAGKLSPETVVAVARAYGADVIDALVVAGVITREDVRRHGVRVALRDALGAEIGAEITRRLSGGEDVAMFDAPLSD